MQAEPVWRPGRPGRRCGGGGRRGEVQPLFAGGFPGKVHAGGQGGEVGDAGKRGAGQGGQVGAGRGRCGRRGGRPGTGGRV